MTEELVSKSKQAKEETWLPFKEQSFIQMALLLAYEGELQNDFLPTGRGFPVTLLSCCPLSVRI